MSEINQEQNGGFGSNNTQIGEQNNYYGLSAKDCFDMAIQLFKENFPKLQQEALDLAENRVNQFLDSLFKKLSEVGFSNYQVFADPDIQYVLFEAQKSYARMGDEELERLLVSLICDRVNCHKSLANISLNEAIIGASKILPKHYNYLSLLFMLHRTQHDKGEFLHIEGVKKDIEETIIPFINLETNYYDVLQIVSSGMAIKGDTPYRIEDLLRRKYMHDAMNYTFKDFVILVPEIGQLSELNKKAQIGYMELTNSGIAMALSNFNMITNQKLSIDNWIK